ncbi:MAG TPA: plastocyanin/azurin family copper-binding protein [Acidimicrobiia bacterium]|nr:plastocyanin/azurin family copper-binding protein [Acidimicrobiia bacterium]
MEQTMRWNKAVASVAVLSLAVSLAACAADTPSAPPPVGDSPTISIQDQRFDSDHVTIEEGDTVTWVWGDGGVSHDVSGDGFKSDVQTEGTFSHTFEDAGDYRYVCTLHSGMRGTVTVVGGA